MFNDICHFSRRKKIEMMLNCFSHCVCHRKGNKTLWVFCLFVFSFFMPVKWGLWFYPISLHVGKSESAVPHLGGEYPVSVVWWILMLPLMASQGQSQLLFRVEEPSHKFRKPPKSELQTNSELQIRQLKFQGFLCFSSETACYCC